MNLAVMMLAAGLALWHLAGPPLVNAQESITRPRVAFFGAESRSTNRHWLDAFRQAMQERGYVDGQNITLDERWAEGQGERFPELAAELVRLQPRVILAVSTPAAMAAKNATTTIPVVFIAGDPLGAGLVPSLARPGGNLTGLSVFAGAEVSGKWLQLLREVLPKSSRVAVLWNPTNPFSAAFLVALRGSAEKQGVKLQPEEARDVTQLESAFASMRAKRAQALIVVVDPLFVRHRGRIVELAANSRLPAMYGFREFVDDGGLMAYGASMPHLFRRAAAYVDNILKGAKAGDLPVEQPTQFELIVNPKTAKALGLAFPPSVMQRADHVVE